MNNKYVYFFDEGHSNMRELLGGKGSGLCEMTNAGLPVPQGFTITTEACNRYYKDKKQIVDEIINEIFLSLEKLEKISDKKFGCADSPLLVSVRSGARVSMPGMMDTILNLGLNDEVVIGLAKLSNNERFAYDSYRRFIQMYSDVVMEVPKHNFEKIIEAVKVEKGVSLDTDLTTEDLKELVERFKKYFRNAKGIDFPTDPKTQLIEAVKAVFRSWDNSRAIYYRKLNEIPHEWGTAVTVQSMVFGNLGNDSGTGVAFSRNPATGENKLYGEFLMNAQGEDVVAGVRTPLAISSLQQVMPDVYRQLAETSNRLEKHYRNMQDMEFTIERGRLYMLQTRNGKRTASAAMKIACELFDEGLITKEEALMQVEPKQLDTLLHPTFDPNYIAKLAPFTTGLPASPGAGCGEVVFSAEEAIKRSKEGHKVILVRLETSPEDIEGMHVSQGVLTVRGGMTSHAAVVARGMGICCVSGCGELKVHEEEKLFSVGSTVVSEGDFISVDGTTGKVYLGKIPTVPVKICGDFERLMNWADELRTLKVRANADTPKDARTAVLFGAQGIGLCRTEHMFFGEDRIQAVREMIVSNTEEQRRRALAKLLPIQRQDFEDIYEEMQGLPVTIRYLDPPLHEFLPKEEGDIIEIANEMRIPVEHLKDLIAKLAEFNPMMGHRGCRLTVSYPEIGEMQARAIIEAAINVQKRHPEWKIVPEIMIPLIGEVKELKFVKDLTIEVAEKIIAESGIHLDYQIGTMIEIPRAALLADEIAQEAEFFSVGTNDLTQMTFGFSRDDASRFLQDYYERKIYNFDPFARIDKDGVGKLIEMSARLGRSTRPNLKVGVCGEHGGDPTSVEFFHSLGLDYVSCSPYRVPIARLAAAQAVIKQNLKKVKI